jgi:hypothetical protein
MRGYRAFIVMIAGLGLAGCTSNPDAPVNQSFPIHQMDRFFESLSAPPRTQAQAPPDYEHQPGYAPAYPPYE